MRPPDHLDECAAAKWLEVAPLLVERGDVDQGTQDALAAYCGAWSQWLEATNKVKTEGAVVRTPQGAFASPWVGIAKAAQVALRQWAGELRITPKSKTTTRKTTSTDPLVQRWRKSG